MQAERVHISKSGGFLRWLLIGLAVLLLALAVIAIAGWAARIPIANHLLQSQLAKAGLALEAGEITQLDLDGARLEGLIARGGPLGEDAVTVTELELVYNVSDLRARHIDSMRIRGLTLALDVSDFTGSGSGNGGTPQLPVTIGALIIEDTQLALTAPQGRLDLTVDGRFAGPQGGQFSFTAAPTSLNSNGTTANIAGLRADLSLAADATATLSARAQFDATLPAGTVDLPMSLQGAELNLNASAGNWRDLSALMTDPWQGTVNFAIDRLNLPPLQTLPDIDAVDDLITALRAAGDAATLQSRLGFFATPARAVIGTTPSDHIRLTSASGAELQLKHAPGQIPAPALLIYEAGEVSITGDVALVGGGLPEVQQRIGGTFGRDVLNITATGQIDALSAGPARLSNISSDLTLARADDGTLAMQLTGETGYAVDYAGKAALHDGRGGFIANLSLTGGDGNGSLTFTDNGCTRTGPLRWTGTATTRAASAGLCLLDGPATFGWQQGGSLQAQGAFSTTLGDVSMNSGTHRFSANSLETTGHFKLAGGGLDIRLKMADQILRYNDQLSFSGITLGAEARVDEGRISAEAALTEMTVNDLVRPRRLGPVRITGTARYGLDRMITADGVATTPGGVRLAAITASHDLPRNKGKATAQVTDLSFTPGFLQPQDIVLPLKGQVADVSGMMSGRFDFSWQGSELTSGGEITATDMAFSSNAYPISGFNTTTRLKSLTPPVTDGVMTATIGSLNIGTLLTGGAVTYELTEAGDIRVPKLEWPWAGGVIGFYDTVIPAGTLNFTMNGRLAEIDLAQLFDIIDMEGLSGTGAISGALPIEISDGAPYMRKGYLRTSGPGKISYTNPTTQSLDTLGDSGPGLLLQALENFEYDLMEIEIDGPLLGEMDAKVTLSGQNPEVKFGYPFRITITTKATIDQVLTAARLGRENARSLLSYEELDPTDSDAPAP